MEETYMITLSDGSRIEDLHLNGNNFISGAELEEKDFIGKLSTVTIEGSDQSIQTLNNAELVQITKENDGWWFILREIPEEEQFRKSILKNESDLQDLAEALDILTTIILEG